MRYIPNLVYEQELNFVTTAKSQICQMATIVAISVYRVKINIHNCPSLASQPFLSRAQLPVFAQGISVGSLLLNNDDIIDRS